MALPSPGLVPDSLTERAVRAIRSVFPLTTDKYQNGSVTSAKIGAGAVLAANIGDAELAAIAGLASAADKGIQFTGAGTATLIDLKAGTYTPTLTNTTNIDASTSYQAQYMRIGNVVSVSGKVDIDPTAAGSVTLGISLPIASNLTNNEDVGGVLTNSATSAMTLAIRANTANDRAEAIGNATPTTNSPCYYIFQYEVI